MKLKDFKKLNENWNNWKEPVKEETIEEAPRYFQSGGEEEQPHLAEMQAMKEKLGTLANDLIDKLGGSSEIQDAQSYLDDAARAINSAMESIRYSLETQGLSEGGWHSDEHETLADKKFADSQAVGQESVDFQVGDYVRIVDGGLRGANGKVIELTTLVTGEPGLVVLLDTDADKRVFGQAGDEVVVSMDKVQPPVGQMRETIRKMVVNKLQEKAKSKNQQQFMGMVKKCQDTGDCASDEVKKAADSMKKSDVKDFASTKHKGLPDKVEEGVEVKDKFDDEVEKRNKKSMKQGLAYLKKEGNLGSFVDSILDEIMDEDLEEAAKCTGPTKKASSDSKGKKWMKCVKSDSGGYKRIHWGQKGVRVTGKSGDTDRKKSFKARHNCSSAKSNTPQGQACKDWAE